jgi:hypothetical protein
MWNIRQYPLIAELIVAIYYGGLHGVAILFGIGTIVVSLAMKRVYGVNIVYLGIIAGVSELVSMDPG